MSKDNPPPMHRYELRITIGAVDWDSMQRALEDVVEHVKSRDEKSVGMASGGWNGCHSVDLFVRDVTPEIYREELEAWRVKECEARDAKQAAATI
jgi:hypothetical protein